MTVAQDILKSGPYNTDGVTKTFQITYQYLEDSDIVVTILNTTTGATLVGVLNTDFTVTDNASPLIGGTFTIANNGFGGIAGATGLIPAGYTLTTNPSIPQLQGESYPNAGLFPSAAVEQALDRLTLICQGLQLNTTQSLKYPVTDSATISNVLPNSTLRANSFLAFDSLGNPIASAGIPAVSVSSAMLPVVQATSMMIAAELLLNGNIPSLSKAITDTNVWEQWTASVNSYAQVIYQNTSNGATASTDIVLNNDQGTSTTHFLNIGINSSGFTGTGNLNKAGAAYVAATTGDLVIGTTTANAIRFVYNGGATDVAFIDSTGFNVPTPTIGTNAANKAYVDNAQFQSVSASVAANALTVGLANTTLSFRNATLTNGSPVSAATGTLSLVVPSTATLGTTNAVQSQLILLVAYNAGTPVLCIVNASGGVNLDETTLISPTTISTGATSASVIYSAAAVSANSPFRVVGYINITEATAGTWTTAPSLVQGYGGQALTSLQSLGNGQTWQDVSGSRARSTTYYNTTSRPIQAYVNLSTGGMTITVNGVNMTMFSGSGNTSCISFIVPPGGSYSASGGTAVTSWTELR